jgi:hypothetical protein
LLVYAFLPDPLGILFDEQGVIVHEISKGTFFYSTLFVFVITQIILILFKKGSEMQFNIRHPYLNSWIQGFHLAINLFVLLLLIFIGFANNAVNYTYDSIQFLIYLGPLILIVWALMLPIFMIRKRS